MIIDMHAHIYKEKIAQKAANSIGGFYGIAARCQGTTEELLRLGKKAGIDRFLVSSVATYPEQVKKINEFLFEEAAAHPELIAFATLHPLMEDMETELDRLEKMNFKGIKLHPDFQEFYADSEEAMAMYEKIGERFSVLLHAGDKNRDWSQPERIARVAAAMPHMTFIAAHLGGYSVWEDGSALRGMKNVYVDTSSSLCFLKPEEAVRMIREHGVERVFFGTDYPLWEPGEELALFNALPLTEEERELILHKNAEAFIG